MLVAGVGVEPTNCWLWASRDTVSLPRIVEPFSLLLRRGGSIVELISSAPLSARVLLASSQDVGADCEPAPPSRASLASSRDVWGHRQVSPMWLVRLFEILSLIGCYVSWCRGYHPIVPCLTKLPVRHVVYGAMYQSVRELPR